MTGWTVGMLCEDVENGSIGPTEEGGRRLRTYGIGIAHLHHESRLISTFFMSGATESRTFAHAIAPPLTTIFGLTPKYAGCQRTKSASLPTLTSPMTCDMPCTMAGLTVYFAM